MAGFSDVIPGFSVRRQNLPFCLVLYSISGDAELVLDGKTKRFAPGNVLIAGLRAKYEYYATGNWSTLSFLMLPERRWYPLFPKKAVLRPARWLAPIQQAAESYLTEERYHYADRAAVTSSYARLIALLLHRELLGELSHRKSLVLSRCESLWLEVDSNPAHAWSTTEMASKVGMSDSHLQRVCRDLYGLTPMDIVMRSRMSHARSLLALTDETLDEIASRVGYATPFSFSRAFKRQTGITPRQFRKHPGSAT